jgi:hypothetical protein
MKAKFYLYISAFAIVLLANFNASAQGCVAVRNMSSCSLSDSTQARTLQVSLNYRYFHSFKHFVGTEEQTEREEQKTNVINNDNSVVLGLNYSLSNRVSVAVSAPFVFIDRSSLYEHLGNASGQRFHTSSKGLGDVRVTGYYSVLNPHSKTKLVGGLGVKLPTGDYNYKDYFHKPEGLTLLPVDQSIQPGDGGLGVSVEVDFSHHFGSGITSYATGYYLFNPRNTNGTLRSANLTANIPLSNEMSVADQFLFRAGARYNVGNFYFGVGGRYEGIPWHDAIGDSDGFRRPGYIISLEPSVSYAHGNHMVFLQAPIALERNRTRSQIDRTRGINPNTGEPYHGDAAFANWLLSVTYAYRFSL